MNSKAVAIVTAHVRGLPAFFNCRKRVVASVADTTRESTVEDMKARGGYSRIIKSAIDSLPYSSGSRANHGSTMWARTISDELSTAAEMGEIRLDSQKMNRRALGSSNA